MQRDPAGRSGRSSTRQSPTLETATTEPSDPIQEAMAMNSNNLFPSFLDNNSRGPPPQQNGNGGPMNGMNLSMPMNAGHQMDVNMLYQKVIELSEVLRENREKTKGIVSGAEELAVRIPPNCSPLF